MTSPNPSPRHGWTAAIAHAEALKRGNVTPGVPTGFVPRQSRLPQVGVTRTPLEAAQRAAGPVTPITMPKSLPPCPMPPPVVSSKAPKVKPVKAKATPGVDEGDAKLLRFGDGTVCFKTPSGKVLHRADCGLMRGKGSAAGDTDANGKLRHCKSCCHKTSATVKGAKGAAPKERVRKAATYTACKVCSPGGVGSMTKAEVETAGFLVTPSGTKYHGPNCRCLKGLRKAS